MAPGCSRMIAIPAFRQITKSAQNMLSRVLRVHPRSVALATRVMSQAAAPFLMSWGKGVFGSLGDGGRSNRLHPAPVEFFNTLPNIKSVAAGWGHSAAILENGELYTWGWELNMEATIHAGAQYDRYPNFVRSMQSGLLGKFFPDFMSFRRGNPTPKQLPEFVGVKFKKVVSGGSFMIAIDEDGHAWTWGYNYHGQCGLGDGITEAPVPEAFTPARRIITRPLTDEERRGESHLPSHQRRTGVEVRFVQAAAGFHHSLLLDTEGEVWVCGHAQRGQLGLPRSFIGTIRNERLRVFTPLRATLKRFASELEVPVKAASTASTATAASAAALATSKPQAGSPSAAERAMRAASRYGPNAGTPSVAPAAFASTSTASSAATSDSVSAEALQSAAAAEDRPEYRLAVAARMPKVTQIAAGFAHSVLLTEDGAVWVFGRGTTGVLGIERYAKPKEEQEALDAVVNVADEKSGQSEVMDYKELNEARFERAHKRYSTFFLADGFDANGDPQETPESRRWVLSDQYVPRPIPSLAHTRVTEIAAGQHHTVALTADGEVWTWGMNRFGACGRSEDENTTVVTAPSEANTFHYKLDFMTPGPIKLAQDVRGAVRRIVGGFYQTAIITDDNRCIVFGPSTHEPAYPLPDHRVRDIAFGWKHALAVVTDDVAIVDAEPPTNVTL